MTRYWTQLEGVSLAGRYWLKQCLTSTPEEAWYLTRYDAKTDASVRVLPANAHGAEEQLALWRSAIELDHPNLVRILDAGRTEAEGADLIYAVCEYPDEFVAEVLTERALSADEAREVLHAALAALGFLHEKGLVHGAVDPSHIMAFGDAIKLPSDTIRPEAEGVSAADDMRSLGATLHEILTQQPANMEGEADFAHLPEPFATIVRNTLKPNAGERWDVADIERYLNPPPAPPVVVPPVEPVRVVAPPVERVVAAEREHVQASAPKVAEPPRRPAESTEVTERLPFERNEPTRPLTPPAERGFPMKWIPIAGLVAAVGLGAVILRKPSHVEAPPPVAPVSRPVQSADRTVPPPPRVEAPRAAAPNPAAIWRVVAYTYNSRAAAEKKARSINEKRPEWRAAVFTPRGDRPPFYVSLGGRMTLPQAERLQKEARSKGLPQDTFVRNFSN